MLIEFDGLSAAAHTLGGRLRFKQRKLPLDLPFQRIGVFLHDPSHDAVGFDGLMDVNGGCRNIKAHPLRFTCPLKRWVKMRIISIRPHRFSGLVMLRHSHRRIIGALFIVMRICLYVPHLGGFSV